MEKSLYKTDGGWRGKKSQKVKHKRWRACIKNYGKQDSSYCDNFSRERHPKLMLNSIFGKSWNDDKNVNFNCIYICDLVLVRNAIFEELLWLLVPIVVHFVPFLVICV